MHQDAALLTASGVAAVVQADGRITPASDWRYTPIAATVQAGAVVSAKVDSQTMLVAAAAVPGTKDRVALVDPVQPQYIGLLADWRWLTAEFTVIALVSALAVALWSRRATAPLEQIAATTEAIANGDVHRRIPYWGQDEYGRISSAINSLTSSLSERMNDVAQEKTKFRASLHRWHRACWWWTRPA
ncbi:hypothetical protein GCM10025857_14200 [Alicyclobacillus contaminans]|nr:hypothetical protein GCM10025857_14200 [Alicyclobacillus contaminans]